MNLSSCSDTFIFFYRYVYRYVYTDKISIINCIISVYLFGLVKMGFYYIHYPIYIYVCIVLVYTSNNELLTVIIHLINVSVFYTNIRSHIVTLANCVHL